MKKKTKWIWAIILGTLILLWAGGRMEERLVPAVGILEIDGMISQSMPALETIRHFEEDDAVKAVIVRIDSPGGTVGPSQEIYGALNRLKTSKPVVASMSAVGASGGYYIACAADSIYALPGTMTGSIGVIMEFMDVSEVLGKLGIKGESIASGALKDAGSPMRKMTEEERLYFSSLIDDVHLQFMEAVAAGRGLDPEVVRQYADGRVLTGRQAYEAGFIDELGGFDEALEEAKRRAGIEKEVRLVREEQPYGMWDIVQHLLRGAAPVGLPAAPGRTVRIAYRLP